MKMLTVEKFNAAKHGNTGPCPLQITPQKAKGVKPCPIEFVVVDPNGDKIAPYCATHLATQLEEDERLRAALLVQLAGKLL
jgi:hypothetical protein